jgi:Na+/proline symporter
MQQIEFTKAALTPNQGIIVLFLLGFVLLVLSYYVRTTLVRNTHDFVIAGRRLGFGFGVAGIISIWTWAMAVMMSSAMTYSYGISGLWWFTVPNGLAVIVIIPFARRLRAKMPQGYTIGEFIGARFSNAKLARIVMTVGLFFGALLAIIINLKGTSLVISTIFSVDQGTVAIITAIIVLTYTVLGGLWATISTSTLTTLFITVPAAFVVTAVLSRVGGAEFVWQTVASKGNELFSVARPEAALGFGITLALGLITATVVGQDFWQVVWGLKAGEASRTFFWAGTLFYPIPICLGILGLIGIALNVDLTANLNGDAAAIGPFIISHIGLPTWLILSYVFVILSACYSTIDGSLSAIASIAAIDVVKPLAPDISENKLFAYTRLSMLIAAIIAILVVLSGVDFVTIVLTTYAIRTAVLIPFMLSVFWNRMTTGGFVWGTVIAIVLGMPIHVTYGELPGSIAILIISAIIPIILGFFNKERFDYNTLKQAEDISTYFTDSSVVQRVTD